MNSAGQAEDAQDTHARIGAVRRFNRFYTRQIGVLRKTYLDSPYSLGWRCGCFTRSPTARR